MPEVAEVKPARRLRGYIPPPDFQELSGAELFGAEDFARGNRVLKHISSRYFVAGDAALLRAPRRVAIIGSREASEDGVKRAGKLARLLAEAGVVVVSGLAKGIDTAAHRGAIEAGGRTVGVIGMPLNRAYPIGNEALQMEIWREHALLSEFAEGYPVYPANFIRRNRTMALLCHATVVVEAGDTSGTIHQVRATSDLGRPLFIMRSLFGRNLKWPESFVKNGAHVLDDVSQVLAALPA